MPTIGSIEPYDGVENFKQYMQRVNFYFTANNVGSEFASTDVTKRDLALAQRKAVLLTVIGKKTFHILTNLLDPKTTEEVTYTDICLKLENYFVPAVLEVEESFRFHRCIQREGESIVSYVSRLREASSNCNYGTFLERALRDQFVSGVSNSETQMKLLQENKTLDECIKLAIAGETATKEASAFKSGVSVNYFANSMQNKTKKMNTFMPSPTGANGNDKKLSGVVCSYCSKTGHVAKKCFSRKNDERRKNQEQPEKKKSASNDAKPKVYSLFNISMSSNPPLLVNVKLGSEICTMEADSGASISVMSLKDFEKLQLHDYSVCPSNDVVKSVTGTEKVHSIVNIPVTVQGKVHRLELRLLDRPCPALFGRDWIVKTGISIDDIIESMNRVDYIANDHDETKCDDSGVNASLSDKMLSEKPALCDIIKPNNSGDNSTEKSVLCDIIKPNNSGDNSTEKSVLCDIIKPYNSGDNSTIETNCDDISYFCDLNDEMLCTNLFSCSLDLESEVKNSDSLYNKGDHEMSVLLNKHTKLFTDGLGKFSKGEANIFIDESVKPVFCKARPLPYAIKDKVEKELDSMVEKEILSPVSYAEWAAPIVPIQKQNGGIRICGDFKVTVNKCSEKDKYPIPRIEDLYTKLAGGTVFSVLDLSMAYQQIVVNQRSRRYLTINTTRGLFTFNRLPAGICAAPGIFQRIMDGLFSNVEGVVCYLDDILVCGKDIQDHNKNLDIVFSILYQSGLKLKKDKCLLAESSVKYLGHIIDAKGLHPLASKVGAIQNAPAPTNVNELQSFIGLISYYGKFLSNMSTVMAPLYELLRKDTDWAWEKDQIEAFDKCKTLINSDSVLVHFDPQYPVVLACDASPYGIGCVLSHSIDGIEKPIAFYSRTLKPAEKNYSVLDKEALSVVCGVKKFHCYLYGRTFIIQSDHKPLEKLLHENNELSAMATPRIKRWSLFLSAYDYAWKYRAGKFMGHADAMSRLPLPDCDPELVRTPAEIIYLLQTLDLSPITSDQIKLWTSHDPILSKVVTYISQGWPNIDYQKPLSLYYNKQYELSVENGCVLWGSRVVIPHCGHQHVLELLHDSHPGIVKMKNIARRVVWWPNIDKDIENYVKSCDNCQSVSAVSTMSTIHPWEWPGKPWIRIHIDYAGPFNGKMYLIVIDSYSKWIEIIPTTSATAEATVTILREIFSRWGLPLMIVSDNATCFTSYIFTDFCKHNAIKHITSSPHHPSTNGLAERAVQVFKHGVQKITGDIDTNISHFLLHYRSCPQSTTGETPSMLMMKRQIRTRIDILLPDRQNDVTLKQAKMLGKGSQRTFYAGDPVYVLNFSQNNKQTKWLSGVIMNKQGPLTYIIELDDGRMFKRHTDHIRYRVLTNIGENSAQADSAPNVVLSENQENDGQMTPYSGPSVKVPRNVPSGSQGVNTPSDQSSVATASLPDEECLSE